MRLRLLALAAILGTLAGAAPARAAGSIRVTVSPAVLLADGISTATVSAEVRGSGGRAARDGTEVRFYTTAGTITQVGFTSAGIARATLTASDFPQAAKISVSAGLDQAVITVPMVSQLVEASVGGRVMKITGRYVAYSEDRRIFQADDQVRVRFRGVEIEANSVQVDLNDNHLAALGRVQIASDDKTLVGERLWLDLKSFEGYIVAVGMKRWFSAYGLTDLPERPKNLNPTFELADLTSSKLIWVGQHANYVVEERVQLQNARAYVGGVRSLRMPFHEVDLRSPFGQSEQYVGFGSAGITVDLPLYVAMSPGASTAFHLGYGSRSGGIGYFTRQRGLAVDLVQKYGFTGASEGQAQLTNLTAPDRLGLAWNHTHQVTKSTRLVTNLQFPEHRDIYGQLNLTSGLPVGTVQLAFSGAKPQRGTLSKTFALAFETKPRRVANGAAALSVETSFYRRDAGEVRAARGLRIPVQEQQHQALGVKVRPRSVQLAKGLTLESSASVRGVVGTRSRGIGPAAEVQARKQLPNNGSLSLGLNYNHLSTINDLLPSQGRANATLNAIYPVTSRFRLAAIGSLALDAQSRQSLVQMSYQLTPSWRLEMLHTLFRFGQFGAFDLQAGIVRSFGSRELSLFWSRREHKWLVEFGAVRF